MDVSPISGLTFGADLMECYGQKKNQEQTNQMNH